MKYIYNKIVTEYGTRTLSILSLSKDFGLKPYQTRKLTQAAGYHNTIRTIPVSYTSFISNKDVLAIHKFLISKDKAQAK